MIESALQRALGAGPTGGFKAVVVALALFAPLLTRAQAPTPRVAVIAIEGDDTLRHQLVATLTRLELANKPDLPPAFKRRLMSDPALRQSLDAVAKQLAEAEKTVLEMNRARALHRARAAIQALEELDAAFFRPALTARALVTEGLAQLLHPADREAARLAFGRALTIKSDLRADPRRFAPDARVLFDQARARRQPPNAPQLTSFARLAHRGGYDRLYWLAVERTDDGRLQLQSARYDHRRRGVRGASVVLRPEGLASALHQLFAPAPALPLVATTSRATSAPIAPPPVVDRPWYKRWWVWSAVGALVIGAAVGITLAATADDRYDLRFTFQPPGS